MRMTASYPASHIVQKFGGTSVGTPDRIRRAAFRACQTKRAGHEVIVVVSAMAGETDRLLQLARELLPAGSALDASAAERDVVAAAGEQVTAGLTALAIQALGGKARSFLAHQLPLRTDASYTDARVLCVETGPLLESLGRGEIPVVAGFQGVDPNGRLTTLGRGGSDTTAVAIAAALPSAICEIYTDVDGVYTADPRVCADAHKLAALSYPTMLAMASRGAKVLHAKAVALAMTHRVPIHVRSSFSDDEGSWVIPDGDQAEGSLPQERVRVG